MKDSDFITLTPVQEQEFRAWVRDNWKPNKPDDFSVYHPVVRDEWVKMDAERATRIDPDLDYIKQCSSEYIETELAWSVYEQYVAYGMNRLKTDHQREAFAKALREINIIKP